jgi:hypothetical protein
VEQRYNSLKNFLPKERTQRAEQILSKILAERPIHYNAWTKASTMYVSKKIKAQIEPSLIKKFAHSENLLLKETALFAQ